MYTDIKHYKALPRDIDGDVVLTEQFATLVLCALCYFHCHSVCVSVSDVFVHQATFSHPEQWAGVHTPLERILHSNKVGVDSYSGINEFIPVNGAGALKHHMIIESAVLSACSK